PFPDAWPRRLQALSGTEEREETGTMEAKASVRHVRMSPRKMRIVANLVRGKRVDQAMAVLTHTPKRAGQVIKKLLISAVANAEHKGYSDVDALVVAQCAIDSGPILKR